MRYLLLILALTACAPAVVQEQPPVVIVAPAPVITPAAVPVGPITVSDTSRVTVTLSGNTLIIALSPDVTGAWVRLTLPNGRESGVTDGGACHCLGLGSASAHLIAVSFLPGLTVTTSPSLDGPWTVAAQTQ